MRTPSPQAAPKGGGRKSWIDVVLGNTPSKFHIPNYSLQLILLLGTLSPLGLLGADPPTKQVKIKAKRFKFVPSRIKVEVGTTLEIVLASQDVGHGFKIVGTDIDVEIPARGKGPAKAVFRAVKTGRYRFECSRMCGAGHSSMRGVIQVAAAKKQEPPSGPEERGKR